MYFVLCCFIFTVSSAVSSSHSLAFAVLYIIWRS